jgi:single-stranded-DNA-specific exonuclease
MQHAKTQSVRWELRQSDDTQARALVHELGLSPTVARVLINRKITTPEAARHFLNADMSHMHDPFLFKDMDRAVDRAARALDAGEKITVYGDYDVDGAVATSMLVLYLRELGANVDFYIPNRLTEGYSLNKNALDTLAQNGTKLIVTVDNGITAIPEAAYAKTLGLDLIVTDHHKVGSGIPEAVAVVDPQRLDCAYPFKGICGAGVAFKFMAALRSFLRDRGHFATREEPNLKRYFDLLCIPTVCDVVPLVDENRFFVKEGLKHLGRTKRVGLKALLKICQLEGKDVSAYDLGFKLGPRINACGRLVDASLGVRMLTSDSETEAYAIARELDRLNQERRDIEKSITEEAFARIEGSGRQDALGVTVYEASWHVGVVGIVASRLVEKLNRPVFILARAENGLVKGSGRSVPGVNLVAALNDCAECLVVYGGHEAAAGVTLEEANVTEFARLFDAAVKKQLSPAELVRTTWVDAELKLSEIDERFVRELERLEPFGMGNAKPVFAAQGLEVAAKRIVGVNHLKLKIAGDDAVFDAIAFNKSGAYEGLSDRTGLLFGVELNEFNNTESIQLVVKDFF